MSSVQLTDVKQFLNKTGVNDSGDDEELQLFLDRAEAILTKRIGPLSPTPVTGEKHTGPGPLVLRRYPVISVTSATSAGVDVTDLDLDLDSGVLYGSFTAYPPRQVSITYVAGRDFLPADLEEAVLELVRHLWKSQRGGGSLRPTFPGEDDPTTQQPGGASYLLPYRVESLIEPHLLRSIA